MNFYSGRSLGPEQQGEGRRRQARVGLRIVRGANTGRWRIIDSLTSMACGAERGAMGDRFRIVFHGA